MHQPHPNQRQGNPPPGYGWPPHPEAVFVNAPRETTSVTKLTIPAIMAVGLCFFLITATYHATTQFSEIRHAIQNINDKLDRIAGDLTSRMERVEREGWTKADQALWCARLEQTNAGWRCAEVAPSFRPTDPPKQPAWRPATK